MSKVEDSTQRKMSEKSQYEDLMRNFSESHKEHCRSLDQDARKHLRSIKQFPTGSQYEGAWSVLGMSGIGTYTFPNDVIYEGEFDDGMFHGSGKLTYPSGEVIKGKFRHGNLVERTLIFADGLEYSENDWLYCQMGDRRYTQEYELGVKAAGESYLTADQPPRDIPAGYYDTGDGFYDPVTKMVYKAEDLNAIIRSPHGREQKWIVENCRYAPCQQIGPRPDLYEEWLEPETETTVPPRPAAVSRACMHLFQDPDPEEEMDDDSDTEVMAHWQNVLEDSLDASPHWRHLKFQPSKEIQLLSGLFQNHEKTKKE